MSEHASRDLPIDLDHVSPGDLEHRVRSLPLEDVRRLVEHEEGHGRRQPVLTVLRARVGQLEAGAQPSGGDASTGGVRPSAPGAEGPVSGDTARESTPTIPHGDPTNPGQPRT